MCIPIAPRCRLYRGPRLRLEHCVECPATSAWNYDTPFCSQFLDEQGTDSYRRYSTIANLKPIEGFVTPNDMEARVSVIETKLDELLLTKFPAETAHAVQLMASYTPRYKMLVDAGEPNLNKAYDEPYMYHEP